MHEDLPWKCEVSSYGGDRPSMGFTPHACMAWVSSTHLPQVVVGFEWLKTHSNGLQLGQVRS